MLEEARSRRHRVAAARPSQALHARACMAIGIGIAPCYPPLPCDESARVSGQKCRNPLLGPSRPQFTLALAASLVPPSARTPGLAGSTEISIERKGACTGGHAGKPRGTPCRSSRSFSDCVSTLKRPLAGIQVLCVSPCRRATCVSNFATFGRARSSRAIRPCQPPLALIVTEVWLK
jgi:hypothetical protein